MTELTSRDQLKTQGWSEALNDPKAADYSGLTWADDSFLMSAASLGKLEVVKKLIESKSSAQLENAAGETALTLAEAAGHMSVVEYLMDKSSRKNLAQLFITNLQSGQTKSLLKYVPFLTRTMRTRLAEDIFQQVIDEDKPELLSAFLALDPCFPHELRDTHENEGPYYLAKAILKRQKNVVKIMLAANIETNTTTNHEDENAEYALPLAVKWGDAEIVRALLIAGAWADNIAFVAAATALQSARKIGLGEEKNAIAIIQLLLDFHFYPQCPAVDASVSATIQKLYLRKVAQCGKVFAAIEKDTAKISFNKLPMDALNAKGQNFLLAAAAKGRFDLLQTLAAKDATYTESVALVLVQHGHFEILTQWMKTRYFQQGNLNEPLAWLFKNKKYDQGKQLIALGAGLTREPFNLLGGNNLFDYLKTEDPEGLRIIIQIGLDNPSSVVSLFQDPYDKNKHLRYWPKHLPEVMGGAKILAELQARKYAQYDKAVAEPSLPVPVSKPLLPSLPVDTTPIVTFSKALTVATDGGGDCAFHALFGQPCLVKDVFYNKSIKLHDKDHKLHRAKLANEICSKVETMSHPQMQNRIMLLIEKEYKRFAAGEKLEIINENKHRQLHALLVKYNSVQEIDLWWAGFFFQKHRTWRRTLPVEEDENF